MIEWDECAKVLANGGTAVISPETIALVRAGLEARSAVTEFFGIRLLVSDLMPPGYLLALGSRYAQMFDLRGMR